MTEYFATPAPRLGGFTTGKAPTTGSFTGTGSTAWFTPEAGRPFNIDLSGTFSGMVCLERSFNEGSTVSPLTAAGVPLASWTAPASESWEESETGVWYRLTCADYTSGTINYWVSQ